MIRQGARSAVRKAQHQVAEVSDAAPPDAQGQPRITYTSDATEEEAESDSKDLSWPSFDQAAVSKKLGDLLKAYNDQVVYVVGKETMRISQDISLLRRIPLAAFLWLRENTRTKVQALRLTPDKLVEIGFVKEVV